MISNKTKREIQCLSRLHELTSQLGDILLFLKQENLIEESMIYNIKHLPDPAKEVQALLRDLQVKQKLQMLEYQWSVLPVENINVIIITDRNQKEFIFNG